MTKLDVLEAVAHTTMLCHAKERIFHASALEIAARAMVILGDEWTEDEALNAARQALTELSSERTP